MNANVEHASEVLAHMSATSARSLHTDTNFLDGLMQLLWGSSAQVPTDSPRSPDVSLVLSTFHDKSNYVHFLSGAVARVVGAHNMRLLSKYSTHADFTDVLAALIALAHPQSRRTGDGKNVLVGASAKLAELLADSGKKETVEAILYAVSFLEWSA